jgi:hypothetical protein
MREVFRVTGRGCGHCELRAKLLQSEDTCPETYRCPMCRARWIFCDAEVCTGCRKPVSLFGTAGSIGESEPEGLLIEGAAYCWQCAEGVIERRV